MNVIFPQTVIKIKKTYAAKLIKRNSVFNFGGEQEDAYGAIDSDINY